VIDNDIVVAGLGQARIEAQSRVETARAEAAAAHTLIAGICDESSRFIEGLDRTLLGGFAVPDDVFSAAEVLYRLTADMATGYGDSVGTVEFAAERVRKMCGAYSVDVGDAVAEVLFWWGTVAKPFRSSVVEQNDYDDQLSQLEPVFVRHGFHDVRVSRLSSVCAHPEMYDYFEAGIWDVDTVSRFISEGVDVELAVSLNLP